jgi:hypothetical protein
MRLVTLLALVHLVALPASAQLVVGPVKTDASGHASILVSKPDAKWEGLYQWQASIVPGTDLLSVMGKFANETYTREIFTFLGVSGDDLQVESRSELRIKGTVSVTTRTLHLERGRDRAFYFRSGGFWELGWLAVRSDDTEPGVYTITFARSPSLPPPGK